MVSKALLKSMVFVLYITCNFINGVIKSMVRLKQVCNSAIIVSCLFLNIGVTWPILRISGNIPNSMK